MWFLVIVQCWKHWDSKYSKTFGIPVYAVDWSMALEHATSYAFSLGYGGVTTHEVIKCGGREPRSVYHD